jgi:hypothetical protein
VPLPAELLEAYRGTDYVVFGEPELVLRIGEPNPDLDELLDAEGATTAAFITAANPRGKRRGAWENAIANAALVKSQNVAGFRCFEGEGRAPDRKWVERSVRNPLATAALCISRPVARRAINSSKSPSILRISMIAILPRYPW